MAELDSVSGGDVQRRVRRLLEDSIADFLTPSSTLFSRLTTATTVIIPTTLGTTLSTAATSAELIIATTKLQDRVNDLHLLLNKVVYILQANSMATT